MKCDKCGDTKSPLKSYQMDEDGTIESFCYRCRLEGYFGENLYCKTCPEEKVISKEIWSKVTNEKLGMDAYCADCAKDVVAYWVAKKLDHFFEIKEMTLPKKINLTKV